MNNGETNQEDDDCLHKNERTIASRVNAIFTRKMHTIFRMEVLWCYSKCQDKELKVGALIERDVTDVFAESVLRQGWAEEDDRR